MEFRKWCTNMEKEPATLGIEVERQILRYLHELKGNDPTDLYRELIHELERVLFRCVLQHTNGNRTHAAAILGISRNTLRRKLNLHDITLS